MLLPELNNEEDRCDVAYVDDGTVDKIFCVISLCDDDIRNFNMKIMEKHQNTTRKMTKKHHKQAIYQ